MTPNLRSAAAPSPLLDETHSDTGLVPPFPYDAAVAGRPELPDSFDPFDVGANAPGWLTTGARAIRPLCVGALMAIPTLGAATVGAVALVSGAAADRMVHASTSFLAGIPIEIVVLIGALSTGYGFAKTLERLKGRP